MKKLSIVLLSSLSISCFVTTVFAENPYRFCPGPCYTDWGTDLEAICNNRVCHERAGIDLEAQCRKPWCAKRKFNGQEERNDKYSTEWYK